MLDRMGTIGRRSILAGLGVGLGTAAFGGIGLMSRPAAGQESPGTAPAPQPYAALALQTECHAVNGAATRSEAEARMLAAIDRIAGQIRASKGFIRGFSGLETRLVVLPEYVLTGFPLRESVAEWRDKAALDIDGRVYQALAQMCRDTGIFLAGNAYEIDPRWPELYFQTCFLMTPEGRTVQRYRRLISMFTPSPLDIWDAYLDAYGLAGVFPVADTEIGAIAPIASEEILYPEIARCFAVGGAEILVHPTSEAGSPLATQKEIARRARAIETMTYVVSANTAAIQGVPIPAASTTGKSAVIDPDGSILAQADAGESLVAYAELDIEGLRRRRARPGMSNLRSRQPLAVYAQVFAQHRGMVLNGLLSGERVRVPDRSYFLQRQLDTLQTLR